MKTMRVEWDRLTATWAAWSGYRRRHGGWRTLRHLCRRALAVWLVAGLAGVAGAFGFGFGVGIPQVMASMPMPSPGLDNWPSAPLPPVWRFRLNHKPLVSVLVNGVPVARASYTVLTMGAWTEIVFKPALPSGTVVTVQ
jgi:hypothetical protein